MMFQMSRNREAGGWRRSWRKALFYYYYCYCGEGYPIYPHIVHPVLGDSWRPWGSLNWNYYSKKGDFGFDITSSFYGFLLLFFSSSLLARHSSFLFFSSSFSFLSALSIHEVDIAGGISFSRSLFIAHRLFPTFVTFIYCFFLSPFFFFFFSLLCCNEYFHRFLSLLSHKYLFSPHRYRHFHLYIYNTVLPFVLYRFCF